MNKKIITKKNIDSVGSNYDDNEEPSKVIELYPSTVDRGTRTVDDSIIYRTNSDRRLQHEWQRLRTPFRDKISFDQIRKKAEKVLFDHAFNLIVDALDDEVDQIERSNLFDEWKDSIENIIVEIESISVNHRKILGALKVATIGKDISDFNSYQLNILRESTYMVKQLRLTKSDCKRTISKLLSTCSNMTIPLAVESISENEEKSLNQLMQSLVKMSK